MEESTDDGAMGMLEIDAFGLGDASLVIVDGDVLALDGAGFELAVAEGDALAAGDELASVNATSLAITESSFGSSSTQSLALGEDSLVTVEIGSTSYDGPTDSASSYGTTSASGGDFASTDSSSTVALDGEVVTAAASGAAVGDDAASSASTSTTINDTAAVTTKVADAVAGASGGTDQVADAAVEVGDGNAVSLVGVNTGGPGAATASALGVAVIHEDFDLELEFSSDIDLGYDISSDFELDDGNGAFLTVDANAFGESSLVDIDSSVLATDDLSSVSLSISAVSD